MVAIALKNINMNIKGKKPYNSALKWAGIMFDKKKK